MGYYIEAHDVTMRYPVADTYGGADELERVVSYAENAVDGMLSPGFSVPFTEGAAPEGVNDLCIDEAYRRLLLGRNSERAKELQEDIERRVKALLSGEAHLVDTDGTVEAATSTRGQVWSETMNYKPTFDMRDAEEQHIDPDRLDAEDDADDGTI
jgi:hypothetical protein